VLPYPKRYAVTKQWNLFVIWAGKVICGMDYRVKGWENLTDRPTILLSKHQSAWETIYLLGAMPHPLVFVFKKSLLYVPFFGWALGLLRMIPIDRSRGRDAFKNVVIQGKRRRHRAGRAQFRRMLAAKLLPQKARYNHGIDRSRHPDRRPFARRTDGTGGALDRERNARDLAARLSTAVRIFVPTHHEAA
jgi:1-acyl-sn-glycerol-3-phosphate acyltransferase